MATERVRDYSTREIANIVGGAVLGYFAAVAGYRYSVLSDINYNNSGTTGEAASWFMAAILPLPVLLCTIAGGSIGERSAHNLRQKRLEREGRLVEMIEGIRVD